MLNAMMQQAQEHMAGTREAVENATRPKRYQTRIRSVLKAAILSEGEVVLDGIAVGVEFDATHAFVVLVDELPDEDENPVQRKDSGGPILPPVGAP